MLRVVIVACAALLFVPVYLKSRTNQDISARAAFRAISSGRVSVKVDGNVHHPGIYEASANIMAINVIKMAEPLYPLGRYNIYSAAAHPLQNGSALKFAALPDGSLLVTVDQMTVPERLVLGIPLDITTMSEADFDRLPGIGPALARRIIEYRQKNGGILRVEDLNVVEGVGEKKYKMLLGYFQHAVNTK